VLEDSPNLAAMSKIDHYRRMTYTPDDPGPMRKISICSTEERGILLAKHMVFIIKCEPHFPKVVQVARRYNHFIWLRNILQKQFPCTFAPPVPEKNRLAALTRNQKFFEERRADLERFLNRLEVIPYFHSNQALLIFLTCPESTFVKKTKQFEQELMLISSSERLRSLNPSCAAIKLPTDLDFEIERFRNEFSVRRQELDEIYTRCLQLLQSYEAQKHAVEKFNESISQLKTVEEQFPRRDLVKRNDANLKDWETFHEEMYNLFLRHFTRNIRHELQDAEALLENVACLENLRVQHDKLLRTMEKWATYNELTVDQMEQKKTDGEAEAELSNIIEICTKIVVNNSDTGWQERVSEYRKGLRTYSKEMFLAFQAIFDE